MGQNFIFDYTVYFLEGNTEPVNVTKNPNKPDVYDCEYYPLKTGNYTVDVEYGGKSVPKSPFKVNKDG